MNPGSTGKSKRSSLDASFRSSASNDELNMAMGFGSLVCIGLPCGKRRQHFFAPCHVFKRRHAGRTRHKTRSRRKFKIIANARAISRCDFVQFRIGRR